MVVGRDVGCACPARRAPATVIGMQLRGLALNTLFARAVVEQGAPGLVRAGATSLHVVHAYGMGLLVGEGAPDDAALDAVLTRPRDVVEWLQVWPRSWAERFDARAPASVERHTRVNFAFSPARYRRPSSVGHVVVPVDRALFATPGSVAPRWFWPDADAFLARGAGFAVLVDGAPAALAFAGFVVDDQLEIGIETHERHRGRGLAKLACAALIDHCIAHDLEPVWACREANVASHRLAESLGFVPTLRLPYFRLPATA